MRIGFNSKPDPETCRHPLTMAVNAGGIERVICELCGHVSIDMTSDLVSSADRAAFAREADEARLNPAPRHAARFAFMATSNA